MDIRNWQFNYSQAIAILVKKVYSELIEKYNQLKNGCLKVVNKKFNFGNEEDCKRIYG